MWENVLCINKHVSCIKNRLLSQATAQICKVNLPLPPSITHHRIHACIYAYWLWSTTKAQNITNMLGICGKWLIYTYMYTVHAEYSNMVLYFQGVNLQVVLSSYSKLPENVTFHEKFVHIYYTYFRLLVNYFNTYQKVIWYNL